MDYINAAVTLSKHLHDESTFLHNEKVAEIAAELILEGMQLDQVKIVAYLHNILETRAMRAERLRDLFGYDIAMAVLILTRRRFETHSHYIRRIRRSRNKLAFVVKHADLIDHLDSSTFDASSIKKYEKALRILHR